jgi:hypothetical protein
MAATSTVEERTELVERVPLLPILLLGDPLKIIVRTDELGVQMEELLVGLPQAFDDLSWPIRQRKRPGPVPVPRNPHSRYEQSLCMQAWEACRGQGPAVSAPYNWPFSAISLIGSGLSSWRRPSTEYICATSGAHAMHERVRVQAPVASQPRLFSHQARRTRSSQTRRGLDDARRSPIGSGTCGNTLCAPFTTGPAGCRRARAPGSFFRAYPVLALIISSISFSSPLHEGIFQCSAGVRSHSALPPVISLVCSSVRRDGR